MANPGLLYSLFHHFNTVDSKYIKIHRFEPHTSCVGSDRSANYATATALQNVFLSTNLVY